MEPVSTRRKDAKDAKILLVRYFFSIFVLYRDVRMPRAQDAQEWPSLRQIFSGFL